jgi:hypothetical protein
MRLSTFLPCALAASTVIAALTAAQAADAQTNTYPPGTNCQRLNISQQAVCESQMGTSQPPTPAANGTGTNQNGTMSGSGETNGSTIGGGGGNGGANGPGQPIPPNQPGQSEKQQ